MKWNMKAKCSSVVLLLILMPVQFKNHRTIWLAMPKYDLSEA